MKLMSVLSEDLIKTAVIMGILDMLIDLMRVFRVLVLSELGWGVWHGGHVDVGDSKIGVHGDTDLTNLGLAEGHWSGR